MKTILPSITQHLTLRPGQYGGTKQHFIPNVSHTEFWGNFYEELALRGLSLPCAQADKSINPYFGYFGLRFHPTQGIPHYFHAGIDFDVPSKTPVFPVTDGVLEYSGFGIIDGKYVMLSHPEICTEDGFTLHSLYMHLRDTKVAFTPYQKMLREVSFNTYPRIGVPSEMVIGTVGQTGNTKGYPHLHLQLEFRNEKGDIVLIDPAQAFGIGAGENLSQGISNEKEYEKFLSIHQEKLAKSALRDLFKNKL